MMDLYKIAIKEQSQEQAVLGVLLNAEHPIFAGHFPNHPILPGVCMVQLVSDALQCVFNRTFRLHSASNIKFTAPVNPEGDTFIDLLLRWHTAEDSALLKIDAQALHQKNVCLKLKALFETLG